MRFLADLRRLPRWEAVLLTAAAAAMAGWWAGKHWAEQQTGSIVITGGPGDATIFLDGVRVNGALPATVVRAPGAYTLSITRDGYTRSDQQVEIHLGRVTALEVTLEPSPDTGFELTSEPSGAVVWLDGAPLTEASGAPARTNFRAFRISPGQHVVTIYEPHCKTWQQDILVEPGVIRKIHALLIPAPAEPLSPTVR